MGRRSPVPPEEGTVEVLERWRPERPARDGGPARTRIGLAVGAAVLGLLVVSSWSGRTPGASTAGGRPEGRSADSVSRTTLPPSRFDAPVGHRLVVLTLTGVLLLDPDTGSFSELELGAVRSFGASPAVAAVGPREVAVLFADRSVGVVDLEERSVRRIASEVQAVLPAADPGSLWIRRQVGDGWELTQLDATGQALSVPVHHPGDLPPAMAGGRPLAAGVRGPIALDAPGGAHVVEVHERSGSLHAYEVRIEERATGRERWLRELSNQPVLTPDGRYLLVGEPITNRLTAYDVDTLAAETLQAPESAGVTLDWENVVVLPAGDPPQR